MPSDTTDDLEDAEERWARRTKEGTEKALKSGKWRRNWVKSLKE